MIRGLFNLVVAVSLLLFVAIVTLWIRSRWTMDHFWLIHGDDGSEMIRSADGRLTLRHSRPNGRSRITLPQRVSHWGCTAGSQLPPKPSPLHWEWRFLSYEGTPEATPAELGAAQRSIQNATTLRTQLNVTEAEWEEPWRFQRPKTGDAPLTPERYARQMNIARAKMAADQARNLLTGSSYWEWTAPAWLPAVVTAVPPALWIAAWRRRRRLRREGRCPGCGYDLRASRERCPECGLAMGSKSLAASTPAPQSDPELDPAVTHRYTA